MENTSKKTWLTALTASFAAVFSTASHNAGAQTDSGETVALEEIIVTAARRTEDLQKTAISVTAISGELLRENAKTDIYDVLRDAPAVEVKYGAGGAPGIAIRGLGTALPPNIAENAVATTYDGNATTLSLNNIGYFDLQRVEVLRGPQGTLYGRNATAGVVNVITADPELGKFSGYGTVGMGNYDAYRTEGAINIPLADSLAFRSAFAVQRKNSYFDNNPGESTSLAFRGKLLYQPIDALSLMLAAEMGRTKQDGEMDILTFSGYRDAGTPYRNPNNFSGSTSGSKIEKYYGRLNWQVGPGVLTLLPAYAKRTADETVAISSWQNPSVNQTRPIEQKSGEVRYESRADSKVKWNVGYFYFHSQDAQVVGVRGGLLLADGSYYLTPAGQTCGGAVPAAGTAISSAQCVPANIVNVNDFIDDRKTSAYFGQATYPLRDDLRLTAGLRYSKDEKRQIRPNPTASRFGESDNVDWKLSAEYDLNPDSLLYFTASTGYRSGGFNPNYTTTAQDPLLTPEYGKETVIAYELGSKNRFWNDRLQLNGAVYYYDYKDYLTDSQVWRFTLPECTALGQAQNFNNSGSCFFTGLFNIPKVSIYGAEVQTEALLTDTDHVNASVSYNNATIRSDLAYYDSFQSTGSNKVFVNYNGKPLTQAPKWNFSAGYMHDFNLPWGAKLSPRADYRYTSSQYARFPVSNPINRLAASGTGDVSMAYRPENREWTLNAYVKNVTNEVVQTGVQPATGAITYVIIDAPRTYGLTLNTQF